MTDIIKVYSEQAPKSRFIGIRYGDSDRVGGAFAHLWGSWFKNRRFETLHPLVTEQWKARFPEGESYIGLMRVKEGAPFEYWIGMFLPEDSPVPAGFDSLELPEMNLGVCLVKGREPDIYMQGEQAMARLIEEDLKPEQDENGFTLLIERYQHPRFTVPDEEGNKILDFITRIEGAAETAADETPLLNPEGLYYCAHCRKANAEAKCPECGEKGSELQADDPIFIGELPGRLRNALQIAFGATEIPFNALANLGSGFTLAAGDLFESYRIYVPFERSEEAKAAFLKVFEINE